MATKKGVVTTVISDSVGLKIRTAMSTSSSSDTGEKLYSGFIVYGATNGNWFEYLYYYDRQGIKHEYPSNRYSAIADPNNLTVKWITVTDEEDTTPPPDPTPGPLPTFEVVVGGSEYEIVSVQQPTANKVIVTIRPIA